MATQADKFIAKRELERRNIENYQAHKKLIEGMTDAELEQILSEPVTPEAGE